MAATGDPITASVGIGQPNAPEDVRRVQHLLNRAAVSSEGHLSEDGIFGAKTQARVVDYQRDTAHLRQPDGVVNPAGPTMRALSGGHEHSSSAEHRGLQQLVDMHPAAHPASPAAGVKAWFDAHPLPQPAHSASALQAEVDAHPVVHHESEAARKWVERALPAAQAVRDKWRVPVSVTLAQGALESGWGTAHPSNEYFGVKGKAPDGKSAAIATHEEIHGSRHAEKDAFRAYGSLEQSADDYGRFLNVNRRYAEAFQHTDDAHRFIHEVAKAHYGSDGLYENKIRSIIDHHGLTRYDKPRELTEAEITKALWANTARTPQAGTASTPDPARALWQAQYGIPKGAQQETASAQTSAQSSRLKM